MVGGALSKNGDVVISHTPARHYVDPALLSAEYCIWRLLLTADVWTSCLFFSFSLFNSFLFLKKNFFNFSAGMAGKDSSPNETGHQRDWL